jgi:hypothetical protein
VSKLDEGAMTKNCTFERETDLTKNCTALFEPNTVASRPKILQNKSKPAVEKKIYAEEN